MVVMSMDIVTWDRLSWHVKFRDGKFREGPSQYPIHFLVNLYSYYFLDDDIPEVKIC
jgi:hypothetical protein